MKSASINELQSQGFVTIVYPQEVRAAVLATITSWKKFCALAPELKTGLPYSNSADGVGYELKDGSGVKGDRKENFDITTAGKQWLEENIKHFDNEDAHAFVRDAIHLVALLKPLIVKFAKQVEEAYSLKDFTWEVEESVDAFFIRFIHYFGDRKVGEEIATAHSDQSGFTLHLFESDEGLECLTLEMQWIPMPVGEGETVIIPSMQLQLRSDGKLKALCHRVVATSETAVTGRYSAVCFVQLKNTLKYNKAKWGRLQERPPGFNYEMPSEIFAELFKK